MTIRRHGHTLTQMPNGIAVQLANGDRHFIINVKMPEPGDYRALDKVIEAAALESLIFSVLDGWHEKSPGSKWMLRSDQRDEIMRDMRVALRARQPSPAACDGCENSYGGHYIDAPRSPCLNCTDGSNREAARPSSTQGEDDDELISVVRESVRHTSKCAVFFDDSYGCNCGYDQSIDALNALRARLAASAKDEGKMREVLVKADAWFTEYNAHWRGYSIAERLDLLGRMTKIQDEARAAIDRKDQD